MEAPSEELDEATLLEYLAIFQDAVIQSGARPLSHRGALLRDVREAGLLERSFSS